MADTVSFNGRPFASSRNLKIIDMSAVKSVSKNNEALFQDIGENSVVYLSSRDIASMFIGSENNTRSYGNGHYCASRTGLIVCRGAQIDIEYTDGRLPLLEKDGYILYWLCNTSRRCRYDIADPWRNGNRYFHARRSTKCC